MHQLPKAMQYRQATVLHDTRFGPKGYIPLINFYKNLAWGRDSQVPTITLTFTFVALKMWHYGRQNRKNSNFWYKFAHKKKSRGSIEKLE